MVPRWKCGVRHRYSPNDSQPLKEWSYKNDWETYSRPTVEAAATLYEGNAQRRYDTGTGHASGYGYDKRSAAVNAALHDLPLLQTLLLWLSRCDYGWALHANGYGMETIEHIFEANDFREVRNSTRDGGYESYHFERVMPSSFLKLI